MWKPSSWSCGDSAIASIAVSRELRIDAELAGPAPEAQAEFLWHAFRIDAQQDWHACICGVGQLLQPPDFAFGFAHHMAAAQVDGSLQLNVALGRTREADGGCAKARAQPTLDLGGGGYVEHAARRAQGPQHSTVWIGLCGIADFEAPGEACFN